jgi:hypothetical protein
LPLRLLAAQVQVDTAREIFPLTKITAAAVAAVVLFRKPVLVPVAAGKA